jgi:general stress protein 26
MDSINQNQPEDNTKNLQGFSAHQKIKELTDMATTCFFCTNLKSDQPFSTRPMAVQKYDDNGYLWFLSAKDSKKNMEIMLNPNVQLLFQGSDYSDFLELYGNATITDDKNIIHELWKPMLKVWFTEGENDPRISAICVKPVEGYYWDTKNNAAVGMMKRAAGAIIGKTIDDSIEGTLRP